MAVAFLLGGGAAVISALSKKKKTKAPPGDLSGEPTLVQFGQDELRYYLRERGLDENWVTFFEATAAGESGFNNLVGLGDPGGNVPGAVRINKSSGEATAAQAAFDRNDYLHGCPWPASAYVFGSGGWFGQLPANALRAYKGTEHECLHPWYVFDPVFSIDMAVAQAKRLMGWDNFKSAPNWLNLRVGWGAPGEMDDDDAMYRMAEGDNKFGDRLDQIGEDRDFMFEQITPLG